MKNCKIMIEPELKAQLPESTAERKRWKILIQMLSFSALPFINKQNFNIKQMHPNKKITAIGLVLSLFISMDITLFAQQPGYRDGTYPTTWPVDMANLNRTSTVVNAGLPSDFDPIDLKIESVQMPFPAFTYTRDSSEVFVFGGMPILLDLFAQAILTGSPGMPNPIYYSQFSPYLMKINPLTLDTVSADLSGDVGFPYLGGALVHENGFVYAVAKSKLFKIDPQDMTTIATKDLPGDNMTYYNGLAVAGNGTIIAKSAVFDTTAADGLFVLIDPVSLNIYNQLQEATGSPRLTVFPDSSGNEYLYHLNRDYTYRMAILEDSLVLDTTWRAAYAPYGTIDNQEPTSPVIANNRVHYTTNTLISSSNAMKIFWQSTLQSYNQNSDTLAGYFMFSDTISAGWNFFHLSIDDSLTGIIIGSDQANGKIAALKIDESQQLQYLWERDYNISARPAIVADREQVYLNHFDATEGFDYFVILDLLTGDELGKIKTPATNPTIATIAVGMNNDVYYCSNEQGSLLGYFHRIYVDSTTTGFKNPLNNSQSDSFALHQNYPNPFNHSTKIGFYLPKATKVKLTIYNSLGEQELVLLNENREAGIHHVDFDSSKYAPGIYFYQIQAENFQSVKKMTLTH